MQNVKLEVYIVSNFCFHFGLNMVSYSCHLTEMCWVLPAESCLKRLDMGPQASSRFTAPVVVKFTFRVETE